MDELLTAIVDRARDAERPILVAVDGPGGAGKTTLTTMLAESLEALGTEVAIVHMEDFYLPSSERWRQYRQHLGIGLRFDWRRLRDQVLVPLRHHRGAAYQRYDWGADTLAEWHTLPDVSVVIVEGISVLRLELREFYDLTIWVECSRAVRLARGVSHNGTAIRQRWLQEWMPAEDRYIAGHRPHLAADFVVGNADPFAHLPSWIVKSGAPRRR